jgi:diacylglycerol kinase
VKWDVPFDYQRGVMAKKGKHVTSEAVFYSICFAGVVEMGVLVMHIETEK